MELKPPPASIRGRRSLEANVPQLVWIFLYVLLLAAVSYGIARLYPKNVFYLEGDGARYMQIALQMRSAHLALGPEFDTDCSDIYPPLLPAAIALASFATGDIYVAAHWVVYLCLIAVALLAAILVRLVFHSELAALFAGGAAAIYLAPDNVRCVLTEPLMAVLSLTAFILFHLALVAEKASSKRLYVFSLGVTCCLATLCRQAGVLLLPSIIIGVFAARVDCPRAMWRTYARPLLGWSVIAAGLYTAYDLYMRSKGGLPAEVLLYCLSLVLHGHPEYWPPYQFDPVSFHVAMKPGSASLFALIWHAPGLYLRTVCSTIAAIVVLPVMLLVLLHVLSIYELRRKSGAGGGGHAPSLVINISLLVLFALNAGLMCLVGQHPNFVSRMFDPWAVCSLSIIAGGLLAWLRSLPLDRSSSVSVGLVIVLIALPLPLAVYDYVEEYPKRTVSGLIAPDVIQKLRETVPAGEPMIASRSGSPNLSAVMAGHPTMYFIGPEDTFLRQMKAHHIRYALWANQTKIDYERDFPGCKTVFDMPFHRLLLCPPNR